MKASPQTEGVCLGRDSPLTTEGPSGTVRHAWSAKGIYSEYQSPLISPNPRLSLENRHDPLSLLQEHMLMVFGQFLSIKDTFFQPPSVVCGGQDGGK